MNRFSVPSIAFVALALTSVTRANDAAAFRFDFTLDAWFPRLVGNVPIGPGATPPSVSDLGLHDSEVAFVGTARATWDRLFVEGRGFSFSTEGELPLQQNSADWWSASVDVGFALWRPFDATPSPWSESTPRAENVAGDGAQRLSLELAPLIGFTWDQVDIGSTTIATGNRSAVDGGWASIRFGGEVNFGLHTKDLISFIESVDLHVDFSVGPSFGATGDGSGVGDLWYVNIGLRVFFTPNIGAHIGYRLVEADFAQDSNGSSDDPLDIGLQGLVAGLAIRF
ncbi:MAG: hypothetical protein SGJ09_13285 [Phycisphaerae bacterium]|nr:hypothetical protein [Phycisphaerae bacterium]